MRVSTAGLGFFAPEAVKLHPAAANLIDDLRVTEVVQRRAVEAGFEPRREIALAGDLLEILAEERRRPAPRRVQFEVGVGIDRLVGKENPGDEINEVGADVA